MMFSSVESLYCRSTLFMKFEKYINHNTEDFILDSDFMNWVLHPNLETDQFWSEFLKKNPEKKVQIKEAVNYIKALRVVEPSVSTSELQNIYQNIESSNKHVWKIEWQLIKIAAVFLLLVSIGGLIYYFQEGKEPLPFKTVDNELFENGKVILPDGTVNEFNTEQTEIKQTSSGLLTINNDTVLFDKYEKTSRTPAMTEIIMPYGKHSRDNPC